MKTSWVVLIGVTVFLGCTVTPKPVTGGISFDGNERNSGLIAFTPDGGGILTSNAWVRYNGLALRYGTNFVPVLVPDAGITPTTTNTFLIDAQHLVKFGTMNYWRRNGLH